LRRTTSAVIDLEEHDLISLELVTPTPISGPIVARSVLRATRVDLADIDFTCSTFCRPRGRPYRGCWRVVAR
jgi:hypothetical protein